MVFDLGASDLVSADLGTALVSTPVDPDALIHVDFLAFPVCSGFVLACWGEVPFDPGFAVAADLYLAAVTCHLYFDYQDSVLFGS